MNDFQLGEFNIQLAAHQICFSPSIQFVWVCLYFYNRFLQLDISFGMQVFNELRGLYSWWIKQKQILSSAISLSWKYVISTNIIICWFLQFASWNKNNQKGEPYSLVRDLWLGRTISRFPANITNLYPSAFPWYFYTVETKVNPLKTKWLFNERTHFHCARIR